MRADAEGIDIDRQRERIAHRKILLARGNTHVREESEGDGS